MILVETPAYKAWDEYRKKTSQTRVYQYGGLCIFLLVYVVLMTFARTPNVNAYNGVDMWFYLVEWLPLGGTIVVSLILIGWMGYYVYMDLTGQKTTAERKKDKADKNKNKNNKNFKVKPKKPFKPNPYYVGIMLFEGFLYGSLLFSLLPQIVGVLFTSFGVPLELPSQFDAAESLWSINSNIAQDIALAFGAGVYEELIFRALVFMLIIYSAKKFGKKYRFLGQFDLKEEPLKPFPIRIPKYDRKNNRLFLLYLVGAIVASSTHFLLPFSDHMSTYGFVYRVFFALVMYVIFAGRGPVTTAWTHIVYDLIYFIAR